MLNVSYWYILTLFLWQYRENYLTAQSLFLNFCLTPVSLLTELVPYLAKLTNPMRNQGEHVTLAFTKYTNTQLNLFFKIKLHIIIFQVEYLLFSCLLHKYARLCSKWMVHFSSYIIQLCLFILFDIFFIFLISAQIAFIQNVGHLSQKRVPGRWDKQNFEVLLHLKDFSNGLIHVFIFRLRLEALDDKDPGISDADSENEDSAAAQSLDPAGKATTEPTLPNSQDPPGELSASQPQPTSTEALLDEEDLLIEEYDSDWLITCHGHI